MHAAASDLIARDLKHLWHPCAQMKDYEVFPPLEIISAQGCYLELADGRKIIDAISSWWSKSLGHGHPRLRQALKNQLEKFEHVILANTTNTIIVELTEILAHLSPTLNKVFYASDGCCAVEIAMKMSVHARQLQNQPQRKLFLALENSYHGETAGALSVSDVGIYRDAYHPLLFPVEFIRNIPYVTSNKDPLWHNCEGHWQRIEKQLASFAETATAIMIEPILQGAGGMKFYSQDFLHRLRAWTRKHDIHLVADEIMTGLGRTGKMLACAHANIEPDFICLGKGLTSGWLPMSAVLLPQDIYDLFYADYATGKSFLHSHTFSGNALAASVAVEVFKVMREENICRRATELGEILLTQMQEVAVSTNKLTNVRGIGAVVAADIIVDDPRTRAGFAVYRRAVELGALLRPLGNTIYWLPPLTMSAAEVSELRRVTECALKVVN